MSSTIGYPCNGGPLDGKMLAYPGTTYHVARLPPAPTSAYPGPAPSKLLADTAEYRLEHVCRDRMAWVFQGWPAPDAQSDAPA